MSAPWICTQRRDCVLTGPAVADNVIDIHDIAHALSHINRYTGHTTEPWSVAQHSILVYMITGDLCGLAAQACHAALLHDAHEAYVGDLATPIKSALGDAWQQLERMHEERVHQALHITNLMLLYRPIIKRMDIAALLVERTVLLGPQGDRRPWRLLDGDGPQWQLSHPNAPLTHLFAKVKSLTPTPAHARDLFLTLYWQFGGH
jgi:hypothetical protein